MFMSPYQQKLSTHLSEMDVPDELKAAEVTPIFKKDDGLDKENYRPVVIVVPHVSKIIERVMYTQIWKISYQNSLQVSEKTLAPNIL